MQQDTEKTKVVFLLEQGEPDEQPTPLAYFPDEFYNRDNYTRVCYAHIGQHGPCVPEYARECKAATPEQYRALKTELEQIGYNLRIVTEF